RLPPLRYRKNESLPMAEFVLAQRERKYNLPGNPLHPECRPLLENYEFPGNIRELRNTLERAILISAGRQITPEFLPKSWRASRVSAVKMPSLEDVERNYITEVLKQTHGKKV